MPVAELSEKATGPYIDRLDDWPLPALAMAGRQDGLDIRLSRLLTSSRTVAVAACYWISLAAGCWSCWLEQRDFSSAMTDQNRDIF